MLAFGGVAVHSKYQLKVHSLALKIRNLMMKTAKQCVFRGGVIESFFNLHSCESNFALCFRFSLWRNDCFVSVWTCFRLFAVQN